MSMLGLVHLIPELSVLVTIHLTQGVGVGAEGGVEGLGQSAPADLECFVRGELGHYARDCEKKVGRSKPRQQLNGRGSVWGPNHDPVRHRS